MSYKCEIIADSLSPHGHRLTTFKVTYPRIIHAEMCRHRILSRNSASSRAIPFKKMVKMVEEDPFVPIAWQKDHKGMQGVEYLTSEGHIEDAELEWFAARDWAVDCAKRLNSSGVTKQLCNRLLEPFMWHTEIITGTEWDNFFELRCPKYKHTYLPDKTFNSRKDLAVELSKYANEYQDMGADEEAMGLYTTKLLTNSSQAEIHIQAIAEMMWNAMNESIPKELKAGEWHIPFGDNMKKLHLLPYELAPSSTTEEFVNKLKIKIATSRCARISYETLGDNPKIDYEADIKLHDMLLENKHMSPFEHCARVMSNSEYGYFIKGNRNYDIVGEIKFSNTVGWCNNFKGFIQYRYLYD